MCNKLIGLGDFEKVNILLLKIMVSHHTLGELINLLWFWQTFGIMWD